MNTNTINTAVNSLNTQQTISYKDASILVAAFVVLRALAIFALYYISGGKELASDIVFHELIINDPLGILRGTAIHIASYPPFQWLIEWSVFSAYNQYFGEMISYRMLMVSVEFFAFILAIKVCMKAELQRKLAYALLIMFIVSPHQIFSSVFFIQEDVIAQLFMLITLALLLADKRKLAIVTMVLGVLIAKLFFVVPLLYIILFQGKRLFRWRALDGTLSLLPIIAVYTFIIVQALNNGGEVPIRDFTPDAKYAGNFWVLLIDNDPVRLVLFKNYSLVLTTAVQFMIIAVFLFLHYVKKVQLHPVILMAIPLAFFFGTFYQHMPEYLLMVWPVAALLCTTVWQHVLFAGALSFAWAPRITHGLNTVVDNFGSAAEARSEVVGPLVNALNIDFVLLNKAALVAETIVYTIVLIWLCVLCKQWQSRYRMA